NKTKGGVDVVDKMVHGYACRRATRRWPMTYFFNLIDQAGVAANTLWQMQTGGDDTGSVKRSVRRTFLIQLGESMIKPLLLRRSARSYIHRPIQLAINHCIAGSSSAPVS